VGWPSGYAAATTSPFLTRTLEIVLALAVLLEPTSGETNMRLRHSTSLFALGFMLVVITPTVSREPKDDVTDAAKLWADVFALNDPDKILALYSPDGVLWGTLSPTIRSDRAALRAYFVSAFAALPNAKVSFGDQLVRVYGNAAVNSGYYTFSYTKDGETKSIPARYSFTYVKDGDTWKIVDHHSSTLPQPPR
jgi:uncharacterized protein (TIGR02246 family)